MDSFFICDSYSPSPSGTPANHPTITPCIAPIFDIIEIDGNCGGLTDNIEVIYDISYFDCVYKECSNQIECIAINYILNSKTLTDSRCYIWQTMHDAS